MNTQKRDAYIGQTITFALESKARAGEYYDIAWIPVTSLARVPVVGDEIVVDSPSHAPSDKDGPGGGHGTAYVVVGVDLGFVGIADENAPVQYYAGHNTTVFLRRKH